MSNKIISEAFKVIKFLLKPPASTNNYWQKKQLPIFLSSLEGVTVNIGSKNRTLGNEVLYADIQHANNLDITCDIHVLPFKDNSVGGIVLTAVLEHVHSPLRAVAECYRVLAPGGGMYVSIPFMQGYHADPNDFQRYTHRGIEKLFENFEIEDLVKTRGVGSSMAGMLREFFSIVFSFNNETLYKCLKHAFGWMFFPLKYVDFLTVNNRFEHIIASGFTVIARKGQTREA